MTLLLSMGSRERKKPKTNQTRSRTFASGLAAANANHISRRFVRREKSSRRFFARQKSELP
jgi:hypothetical protein